VDVDGRPGHEMEAAAAISKKDAQIRRLVVGNDEVEVAVLVHVANGDVVG
jgi:hypothetical protein